MSICKDCHTEEIVLEDGTPCCMGTVRKWEVIHGVFPWKYTQRLTPRTDEGDSAPSQAESTPEDLSTLQGESTPACVLMNTPEEGKTPQPRKVTGKA